MLYDARLGLQQGLHIKKGLVFKDHLFSFLLCFINDLEEAGIKFGTKGKVMLC